MSERDYVILVDENDHPIGQMEKLEAHQKGALHRAFSIFIFNSDAQLLIHRRAANKYHSPNLWTNTCCSHPRLDESAMEAANRRLMEEMGMKTSLLPAFEFMYKVDFDNGLTENEYDHVFLGWSDAKPKINPEEVSEYKYVSVTKLLKSIEKQPEQYTAWFKICLPKVLEELQKDA